MESIQVEYQRFIRNIDARTSTLSLQGESKKSVISKNENWPWWGLFEKKIHDQ